MLIITIFSIIAIIHKTLADNECLNGKDPYTLTKKQILLEFSKGPCSPFVIIPGIMSTKLVVEIDCPVLLAEHPEIFETCGWTDCEKSPIEFWKSVPDSEYQVWIPGFTSPMDIFSFSEQTNFCWAKFVKQAMDFTKPVDEAIRPTKGFRVKIFGNTEGTKDRYDCGDEAIRNLFDSYIQPGGSGAFYTMIERLKKMGYIPGLTYQSLPYNFNKSLGTNELNPAFIDNIKRLNEMTGKKVIIISHSYGGINTLFQLNKMSTEYKKSAIKNWITIAAPFLGAVKNYKTIISGNDQFSFLNHRFGLHLKASLESMSSSLLMFLLLAIDPFAQYGQMDWFRTIEKRMLYEQGFIPFEDTDLKFLPKTTEYCSPSSYYPFDQKCSFGLYNTTANYTVKIADDEYKMIEAREMMTKWNITANATQFYDLTRNGIPIDLKNPEVPVISINLRSESTEIRYTYGPDLREYIEADKFYTPEIDHGSGDGSVVSYSQFIPLFKWAKEYEDKLEGSEPVKIVEHCSIYKNKYNPYDYAKDNGEKEIMKNEFFGIGCDCIEQTRPTACYHSNMIHDSGVLSLVENTLMSGEKSYSVGYEQYVESLEDEYIEVITKACPQVLYK